MKQCAILLAVGMAMTMTVANAQINMLHPTAEGSSIGKLQADSIFFLYADSAFGEEYFAYFYSDTVSGTGEYKDWVGRVVAQRENAYAYFLDWLLLANWEHPCQYAFIDKATGSLEVIDHTAPPFEMDDKWELIHGFPLGTERGKEMSGYELYPNVPNPFRGETVVKCRLPEVVKEAVLVVYDLRGEEVYREALPGRGLTEVEVEGSRLPGTGIYLYTIVCDGRIMAAKRMSHVK